MHSKKIVIQNPTGLHARPASNLVTLSKRFSSKLQIINGNITVDPTSILSLLAGELMPGTHVEVRAEGEDEVKAVNEICEFICTLEE